MFALAQAANDNTKRFAIPTVSRFVVGHIYAVRSVCDHGCVDLYQAVKRTETSVWLKDNSGTTTRRAIRIRDGVECCDPQGRFSMSPVLRANALNEREG